LTIEIVINSGGAASAGSRRPAIFVGLRAPPTGVWVRTPSVPVTEGKGAGEASTVAARATMEKRDVVYMILVETKRRRKECCKLFWLPRTLAWLQT